MQKPPSCKRFDHSRVTESGPQKYPLVIPYCNSTSQEWCVLVLMGMGQEEAVRIMKEAYVPPGYVPAPQSDELGVGGNTPSSPSAVQHLLGRGNAHLSAPHRQQALHWTSGICACFDDVPVCCLGCWCPCVLFGHNVELLEGRQWQGPCFMHVLLWGTIVGICCLLTDGIPLGILASCVPCYACSYRRTLRAKYNLEDAPCGDLVTHLCCHMCAICQEHREIRERSTAIGLPVVVPPPLQTMGVPSSPTGEQPHLFQDNLRP